MNRIVVATGNKSKLKEIKMIMKDIPLDVVSMEDANINVDINEDGETFEDNAIIKAKAVKEWCCDIVIADDSGLEVDYLNKKPGIYSARFMGENTSYNIKNQAIIDKLKGVEEKDRSARFVCAIAIAFPDGKIITKRGTIEGYIGYEPKGNNGFGYDPIVYVPEYNMTTGEMVPEIKNKISHRGKALMLAKEEIKKYINN